MNQWMLCWRSITPENPFSNFTTKMKILPTTELYLKRPEDQGVMSNKAIGRKERRPYCCSIPMKGRQLSMRQPKIMCGLSLM